MPYFIQKNKILNLSLLVGLIRLDDGKKQLDLVFEVIRRNDEWQQKLIEKMQLYSEFYNFFLAKDCGFEKAPQLVIVAEDNEHIGEIFKIIKKEAIPLKDTEMYFTTELKHLAPNMESSLIEFQYNKEANTYKGVVVKETLLSLGDKVVEEMKDIKQLKEEKKKAREEQLKLEVEKEEKTKVEEQKKEAKVKKVDTKVKQKVEKPKKKDTKKDKK